MDELHIVAISSDLVIKNSVIHYLEQFEPLCVSFNSVEDILRTSIHEPDIVVVDESSPHEFKNTLEVLLDYHLHSALLHLSPENIALKRIHQYFTCLLKKPFSREDLINAVWDSYKIKRSTDLFYKMDKDIHKKEIRQKFQKI